MNTWIVRCKSCSYSWPIVGNWSEYERQEIESRPCPKCAAYTLSSPEPGKPKPLRSPKLLPFRALLIQATAG